MTRRVLLATAAALIVCGVTVPASAGQTDGPALGDKRVCVGASDGDPNTLDGVCVWVPRH